MKKIHVLVCYPNRATAIKEIEDNLKSYQKLVGGYIESAPLPLSLMVHDFHAYVNDDMSGLEPNQFFTNIAGVVIISRANERGEEIGLTIPEAELAICLLDSEPKSRSSRPSF